MMTPTRLPLPDVDALDAPAALKNAVAEWHALFQRYTAAGNAEQELVDARPAAVERDREALAVALRHGKPDPGQKALQAHDAQIAEARRQREALGIAVETAARELGELVQKHRDEWLTEVDSRLDKQRELVNEAVDVWAAARERFQLELAYSRWLKGFPERATFKLVSPPIADLRAANGEGFGVADVRDALLADVTL